MDLKTHIQAQNSVKINAQDGNQTPSLQAEWDFIKNKMDAFQRRQNLIIEGIQEARTERENAVYNQVQSFIRNTLGIRGVVISLAYRIGQPRQGKSYPRPILVRFTHPEDRMAVWGARTKLQYRSDNTFMIKEDLPVQLRSVQASLLRVAAIAKKSPDKYTEVSVKDFRLHLNGESYGIEDLEKLPRGLRPSFTSTPGNVKVVVFFGRASRFSNHYSSDFKVGDVVYNNVEQFLAHNRAIIADRVDLSNRAMASSDPSEAKRILNILGALPDQETWENRREEILYTGLMAKFSQSKDLKDYLISSTNRQLGEASPNKTWGIGLTLTDKNRLNTNFWMGNNLQGKTLMKVREELQSQIAHSQERETDIPMVTDKNPGEDEASATTD